MRLLSLLSLQAALLCVAASPLRITSEAQLVAAASTTGVSEYLLSAHLVLSGSRVVVAPGAVLTLRADAMTCGPPPSGWEAAVGLCVLDANATSPHFRVEDGSSLTLDGVALVNGYSGTDYGGAVCVGLCAPSGNANFNDFMAGAATGASLLLNNSLLLSNTAGYPGLASAGGCLNVDSNSTLTVINTTFSGCVGYGTGGAVAMQDSQLVVVDSRFENCGIWGYTSGGALYIVPYWSAASATFTNVVFDGNQGTRGGAWSVDFGVPRAELSCVGCQFTANRAGVRGGAIAAIGASLSFRDSLFDGNVVLPSFNDNLGQKTVGGAICAAGYPELGEESLGLGLLASDLLLQNCTLTNNSVLAATGEGGAVFLADANPLDDAYFAGTSCVVLLLGCTLSGNSGAVGGALYAGAGASLALNGSTLQGNTATGAGGAVAASGATRVTATATVFQGNAAGVAGGGVWANSRGLDGCTASFANCTFSTNSASGEASHGGALSLEHLASATLAGVAFRGNAQATSEAGSDAQELDVTLRAAATSALGAGCGGALFALSSASLPMALGLAGCSFWGNRAERGGGAAVLTGVNASLSASLFQANTADAAGGGLWLGGANSSTALGGGSSLQGNVAPLGAGVALSGSHALALSAALTAAGNVAQYGAVLYADESVAAPAAQLVAAGLVAFNNSAAVAGAVAFLRAPPTRAGAALPACVACTATGQNNSAGSYGPSFASSPLTLALRAPPSARSGEPFAAPLTLVAYDAYGSAVAEWPALSASVAAFASGGASAAGALSGASPALYAAGGASFTQVTLSGAVGRTFVLSVTALSASAPAFVAGLTANATVAIAACGPTEAFEQASLRCLCRPNSARAADGDTACVCSAGYFWSSHKAACAACPDGVACAGGAALTQEGYWRARVNDSLAYACNPGRCQSVAPPNATTSATTSGRRLLQLAAVAAANCSVGHTGPLCSVCCAPGVAGCEGLTATYAVQGMLCVPCLADDLWANWYTWKRGLLLAGCVLLGLLLLLLLFLQPLLPGLTEQLRRLYSCARGASARAMHAFCGAALLDKGAELKEAREALRRKSAQRPGVTLADAPAEADADAEDMGLTMHRLGDLDTERVKRERRKRSFLHVQRAVERSLKPLKVVINFLQIVMTLPSTLRVAWPSVFYRIASRLSVVNVQLMSLPRLACTHPEPSFFTVFHGYTLGTTLCMALMGSVYLTGLVLHVGLRRGARVDKCFQRFTNRCVTASLIILYLAYPSVSQAALSMLSCQALPSAQDSSFAPLRSYLRADARIECSTPKHVVHAAAAVFWVIVYPIGVPLFFAAVLYYYRVPHMARAYEECAWLIAAADLAARHAGVSAPADVDPRRLSPETIPDDYLARLHALFCGGKGGEEGLEGGGWRPWRCTKAKAVAPNRAQQLRQLLRWCCSSGELKLPPLQWRTAIRLEEVEETPFGQAAPPLPRTPEEELAEQRVGFLFESYTCQCWYWEVFELLRKLLLTGIMALVRPGSVSQVVMGLLIAFGCVVAYSRLNPYSSASVNRLGFLAQLNLFLFLLVALLLRVQADAADSDGSVYNGIVGTLSLSLLIVTPASQLIATFSEEEVPE